MNKMSLDQAIEHSLGLLRRNWHVLRHVPSGSLRKWTVHSRQATLKDSACHAKPIDGLRWLREIWVEEVPAMPYSSAICHNSPNTRHSRPTAFPGRVP